MRRSEAMSVKVDTAKLDYLVDMAGEMVIAESLVRHDADLSAMKSPLLQRKIAHLTRITAELQKTAMAMRLVPIGPLFRRMARLVRDLSQQFGKQVEMETQGDDIELDRTIVEELADPLMHMVRNAHGPRHRTAGGTRAAGKAADGAAAAEGHSPGRPGRDRNHRRRARPGPRKNSGKGDQNGADRVRRGPERQRSLQPDLRARVFHRRASDQRLRPRRRDGRGAAAHRKAARPDRDPLRRSARARPSC